MVFKGAWLNVSRVGSVEMYDVIYEFMNENRCLIVSLNFNPGHVSHLVASYRQAEELGYEPWLYVNEGFLSFLPGQCRVMTDREPLPHAAFAIITFPSIKNLWLLWRLRRQHIRTLYMFHEPLAPIHTYREAGYSYIYITKVLMIHCVNALTVKLSDIVLLPSKKATEYYQHNCMYGNDRYYHLPLLYPDERTEMHEQTERRYFSYIGTVAKDHSFDEYLSFIEWAVTHDRLPQLCFLIATRSEFVVPEALLSSDRVTIQQGKPMTDEEINHWYASSYVVWNAYSRTTQSGVLAKSFMFGTSAVVMSKNLCEVASNGVEVLAINDNKDKKQIEDAVTEIISNFDSYSKACRERFLSTFFYRNYNEQLQRILSN